LLRQRTAIAPNDLAHVLLTTVAADQDEHWGGGDILPSVYEAA
jgi:hypothetical protein